MEYNKFETIKSNKLLTLETDDSTQREIGALDVVAGCLFYTHCWVISACSNSRCSQICHNY